MCPTTTKKINSQQNNMTVASILNGAYQVEIFERIEDAQHKWTTIAPAHNDFLSVPYFQFIEKHPPKGLAQRYLVFSKSKQVIGIAVCQLVQLRIGDALTDNELPAYQRKVNHWILKMANMNAVICGNLLLTGDNACYFDKSITEATACKLLEEGMVALKNVLKEQSHPVSLLIFKDISFRRQKSIKANLSKGFNEFALQPNMVLHLQKDWTEFEAYLQAMTSKSRTRAKRAFKLGKPLVKKEFNLDLMTAFLPQIERLYKCIADNAGFNIVYLNGDYFRAFKAHFPNRFRVFGYFIDNELVAFYTTFKNNDELEAHFLGFDDESNRQYQVYLNILFDIIRTGINSKVKYINFARTALEIKSSVGAQPEELFFYGKHTNPLKNQIFSPVLAYFQPKVEWTPRNPFKKKLEN